MRRSMPALGKDKGTLKLIEIHREDIESLPVLMTQLRDAPYRFIVFCDDLSFDGDDTSYKSLKAVLEGGIEGRPENVILYATSNRRHLMSRDMIENERSTAINPGEAVEEKVSLSDRFGLWLGFHRCSQDEFLAMVEGYVKHFRLPVKDDDMRREALEWSTTRGSRSGRVAWQYIQDLAGRLGVRLERKRSAEASSSARQMLHRIDGRRALSDLEMQLRRGHVSGLAGLGDHLPALDRVAALHHHFAGMRIGRHETVGVTDQNQIAVALELVAGIGDDAVVGGLDRRAFRQREIDAVILLAGGLGSEAGDDAAACGPAETGGAGIRLGGIRFLDRRLLRRRRDHARGRRGRLHCGVARLLHLRLRRLSVGGAASAALRRRAPRPE